MEHNSIKGPARNRIEEFQFSSMPEMARYVEDLPWRVEQRPGFTGAKNWPEFLKLAYNGWTKYQEEVLDLTEKAVRIIECEVEKFEPEFGVSGADVEIGRYMMGIPENMVSYPLTKVSNLGNCVRIMSNAGALCVVNTKNMIARGVLLSSLAIMLDRLGHQTELYVGARHQTTFNASGNGPGTDIVCKVKGSNDLIDPARIIFAYSHPGVMRAMMLSIGGALDYNTTLGMTAGLGEELIDAGWGPQRELPEKFRKGYVYIEPINAQDEAPNAEWELRRYLQQIGLIHGEDDE